jgi:Transcription termination factor nusG
VEGVEKTCLTVQMAAGAGALGRDSDVRTSRWYALYVRSRHEKVVESGLRGKGYSAFSPFYRTKRKRVDRIAEIDVPLFPGYVFCCFDPNIRLPILMTPGIVGVVGPGHRPEPVDDVEIASIRTLALVRICGSAMAVFEIRAADPPAVWSTHGSGGHFLARQGRVPSGRVNYFASTRCFRRHRERRRCTVVCSGAPRQVVLGVGKSIDWRHLPINSGDGTSPNCGTGQVDLPLPLHDLRRLQPIRHRVEGPGMRESAKLTKRCCSKQVPRSNAFSCAARVPCGS